MNDMSSQIAGLSPARKALLGRLLKQRSEQRLDGKIRPQDRTCEPHAISFVQQRLAFFDALHPGAAIYNMGGAARFRGRLEPMLVVRSLNTIIARHEVLRMRFPEIDGVVVPEIAPHFALSLQEIDLTALPDETLEERVQALMAEKCREPYDLTRGPLLRFLMIRLQEGESIGLLMMHHAISDGWSTKVLFREFVTLYEAYASRSEPRLPPLSIQYSDYAAWQREQFDREAMNGQRAFWRERLRGAPALLDLPADYPRPSRQDFRGGRIGIAISPALTARVRELAKREGATLFMALMAAFKILLYRYSGQDDVVVGTPVAGRNRPELEPLIGCFLNMLAIRTRIDEAQNFPTFLQAVKTSALAGFANQDVPFEKLLEDLDIERNLAYSPLYQTAFSFEENPLAQVRMRDLELTFEEVQTQTAKVDLALELTVAGEGLSGWFEYRADLFAPWRIERLKEHFLTLLASIVETPEAPIWALNLLADGEREALIAQGRGEWRDYPLDRAIHRLFEQQVDRSPERIALIHRGETLAYAQLDERANRVAALLQDRTATDNRLVGIMVEPSFSMIVGILGILKAGAGYVYLEKNLPDERVKFILGDAKISAMLVDPDVKQRVAALGVDALDLEAEAEAYPATRRDAVHDAPTSHAYAVFTSGSTGAPKGACVDHQGLVNHTYAFIENHDLDENDRVLQFASPSFDAAAATLFPPLLVGAALVLPDGERADLAGEELLRFCEERRISVIHLPVSLWHEWVDFLRERALVVKAPIRVMLVGGDVPDVHRFETWCQLTAEPTTFLNAYGPTEAAITTTLFKTRCDKTVEPVREITLGYPLPNKQIYLLDDHLQPVPLGVPGEICVAGVGLASGYLNRPDLTDQVFVPNPFSADPEERMYRTGDLASYRPDGSLRFLGRRDHQIKLRGFRIELGEIEQALRGHSNVQDVVVVAHEGSDGLKRLAAYLIARNGQPASDAELVARLKKSLPDYMIPASLQWLDRFPFTATGKLDRQALPAPGDKRRDVEGYVAPRTREEEVIAAIWAESLKCERVGIRDNFFDLGGHSLLGARVIARVRERFGGDIPLRALFEHPTVEALASWIARGELGGSAPADADALPQITPDPEGRYQPFPLNDVQQAYWIGRGDSLEMGNVSCHGFVEFDSATLDVPRLNRAWLRLVERHDMLRAVIDPDGMQRVLKEIPAYEFAIADLSVLPDRDRENALAMTRERMSHQVHDVEHWPLFEICVSRIDDRRVRLHVSIDLLIADARSFQILLIELFELYRNPDLTLPPLTLGFRDYVLAEAALKHTRPYREAEGYWRQRLETLPPAPELPLAVSPKSIVKPVFARRSGRLERPHWESLKARARQAGITPSAMTLGVFATILNNWVKESRFTINLTLFNRLPIHPEVNDIFGDFTSITLLEADFTRERTFEDQVRVLQRQLWDDLDHRLVGGIKVQRDLMQQRGIGGARMPVVFTSTLTLDAGMAEQIPMSWLGEQVYSIGQTPQVWLDHQVFEEDGALTFNWDAVEGLFPPGLLDDMFAAYCALLRFLAEDPSRWNRPIPPQIPEWQVRQRTGMNATATPVSTVTLPELFLAGLKVHEDRLAVIAPGKTLTYAELFASASRLAHLLREQGAGPNKLVAIVMDKGWQQIVAAVGIVLSGAAYVPIAAGLPDERRDGLLAQSQAMAVVTTEDAAAGLAWHNAPPRIVVADDEVPTGPEFVTSPPQRPEDIAYLIYTSGSTGFPKGVVIDHRGAVNTILDINERFGVGQEDRVLALSALNFDLSVYDIFGLLAVGGALVIPDADAEKDPAHWEELIQRHEVTLWNSVPALMAMLVEHTASRPGSTLNRLRLVMLSGDWIPLDLPGKIRAQNPHVELYSLGGATEASIWSIYYPIHQIDPAWASVPYGRPLRNQTMHVLNEHLHPAPVWVPGDLYIGGIGLAKEYWGDAQKTAEKFVVHPGTGERLYKTGDIGRYFPDGTIEFLGREDFQVKINGYRIELGEIETALCRHPQIRAAVATAHGKNREAKRLIAYVVAVDADDRPKPEDLKAFLAAKIPEYMIPEAWIWLVEIPLSANGKVDRKALPDPEQGQKDQAFSVPETELEQELATLFAGVLEVERVGRLDNFFEMGGNSIMVVRLIALVRETYLVELLLRDFFLKPTIAQLAESIEVLRWASMQRGVERGVDSSDESREAGEI